MTTVLFGCAERLFATFATMSARASKEYGSAAMGFDQDAAGHHAQAVREGPLS
jgi:hypothetical protein